MKSFLNILFPLLLCLSVNAQEVRMITELAPGPESGLSDDAVIIGTVNNSIVIADMGQVIISNGFDWGTRVIGDTGTDWSIAHHRAVMDGKLYFVLRNDENNHSLMEVDPITNVMRAVTTGFDDLGPILAYEGDVYGAVEVGFTAAFVRFDLETGEPENVFPINSFGGMRDAVVFNDRMYSIHWSEIQDGAYLASSNGTLGNVDEFFFFHDGSDFSTIRTINMTVAEDKLYFWYINGDNSHVFHVSDGTAAGTRVLFTGMERINFFDFDANRAIGTLDDKILFRTMLDGENGRHLFVADGSLAGTERVEVEEDVWGDPRFFTNHDGLLYFYGAHTAGFFDNIYGMMVSDGTPAGTRQAWDPGDHPDDLFLDGWNVTSHQGSLFFEATSDEFGAELYMSDGTIDNTERISEIYPGSDGGFTYNYRSAGDNLFFFANTPETGNELWTVGPATSSVRPLVSERLELTPNPTSDFVTIVGEMEGMEQIDIYDSVGKRLQSIRGDEKTVDVSHLIEGYYHLRILADQKIYTAEFIKN